MINKKNSFFVNILKPLPLMHAVLRMLLSQANQYLTV